MREDLRRLIRMLTACTGLVNEAMLGQIMTFTAFIN